MKLIHKYFWLFFAISFSILSFLSYGFIKDLYFWHEDYVYINSFYTNWYDHPLYQGELLVLWLFSRFFGDQPMGYFISALVIYIALSLMVSTFAYFFTKKKLVAFLAGIIFASGYIGSENMQMVEIGITHTLYLILALLTVIIYAYSHTKNSIGLWLFSFVLFVLLTKFVPVRAHTIMILLFLTEIYLFLRTSKKSYLFLFKSIARLSIFALYFSYKYNIFHYKFFFGGGSNDLNLNNFFSIKANLNLLADFGNFLLPSEHLAGLAGFIPSIKSLPIASIVGFVLLLALSIFVFLSRRDKNFQKLLVFFILSWILSYLSLFGRETGYSHSSSYRYLFFAYPFYAFIVALLIAKFFIQSKRPRVTQLGCFLIILVIASNLIFGYISPTRKFRLERGFYLQKFVKNLKASLPQISGKTLFYFDVVYDPRTLNIFNSFLQGGRASYEGSLGFFYHRPTSSIKLATDYDDFVSEYKTVNYQNAYAFYYSDEHKLINLTDRVLSKSKDSNTIEIPKSKISFVTETVGKANAPKNINTGLSINVSSFPSYRPVKLDIDMELESFGDDQNIYPYPIEISTISNLSSDTDKRKALLDYIVEKQDFKNSVEIHTSKLLDKQYVGDRTIDNDLATSWIAHKQSFFGAPHNAWIQMVFPQEQDISQIRWISSYKTRLPVNYGYQISERSEGPWKTILSVRDRKAEVNKYVVDEVPTTRSRYLRMIIYKAASDSPAISEIEVLKVSSGISSEEADSFLEYPLAGVLGRIEAEEVVDAIKDYQKIKVYPLTDEFPEKNQVHPISVPVKIDDRGDQYTITLPASGTELQEIIIEFPKIPLSAEVNSVKLTLLPL